MIPRFTRLIPFVFVFLWSTGFIAAKYALVYIEPFTLLLVRMLLTLCILFAWAFFRAKQWPSMNQVKHQMVVGVLIHGTYLGGVFAAIKLGLPAGTTAIIVGIQPVLTALISVYWFQQKLSKRQYLGFVCGLLGVVGTIGLTQGFSDFTFAPASVACSMAALLGITLGSLYQKKHGANVDLLAGTVWQYVGCCIIMAILSFSFESQRIDWSFTLIAALTWLIFALSIVAILLLMYLIREGEVSKVASYFYLVPVVASILAWWLFDEILSLPALVAMGVTVFGVYLVIAKEESAKE
ncbi:MAG: EamA family transporter [Desulfobacteraceae bacterium]|nr:EamA family transporter [Desulfobacteraceae bacterium]